MEQETSTEYEEEDCFIIPPEYSRFLLVGVFGMAIALLSLLLNSFLFIAFTKNPNNWSSNRIYLTFLALADIILSVSYIFMFPVNIYMEYYESEILAFFWWRSMRVLLAVVNVVFSFSALLIIAAAFEGLATMYKHTTRFAELCRFIIIGAALILACTAKLPMYFEVEVVPNGICTGVNEFLARLPEFSLKEPYATVYKLWYRGIVTVFYPFFIVVFLNLALLIGLFQHQEDVSQQQRNIRSETLILFFLTLTYIASNILNVAIYTWELVDSESLLSQGFYQYYTLIIDLTPVLFLIASCLRLPIYVACSKKIRQEVLGFKPCQNAH